MKIGTQLTYLNDDSEWTTGIVAENDGGDPILRVMHGGEEYAIRIVLRETVYY